MEVAISDTGHGLTDEIRERLFLPFYSTKQRGTGLGLSIAAKIAQEHNGSIRAEANSPKGARFLLCLPVMEGAIPASAAPSGIVSSIVSSSASSSPVVELPAKAAIRETEAAALASNGTR